MQLPLEMRLRPASSFENFAPGFNLEALHAVRDLGDALVSPGGQNGPPSGPTQGRSVYLWGSASTGKTHLLEALCRQAASAGSQCGYLPLGSDAALVPAMLRDWGQLDLVCIDNLDAIAGDRRWEAALFATYNELEASGGYLLVASRQPPGGIGLGLPDLQSRLAASLVLLLQPLDDKGRAQAFRAHATERGLSLGDGVTEFVLRRIKQDMGSLMMALEQLDQAAFAAQRRLTLPFVSQHLHLAAPD